MIIKFNQEGHAVMVFGRKKEASDEGAEAWKHVNPPPSGGRRPVRQPTDVAGIKTATCTSATAM